MTRNKRAIERMKVTEAREHWKAVVEAVFRGQKQVVLERSGIAVAALVSIDDLRRLRRYDAQREADFAILDELRNALADVPDEELEREINKALAEVRTDMRAEREQVEREHAARSA